jgi:hypothetical protein
LLSACGTKDTTATPIDVYALQTVAVQTVFAGTTQTAVANVPTDTPTGIPEIIGETPTLPIATNTPVKTLVPLYWEVTWENLGRLEQELLVNEQTNKRITLSGYAYQAPLPSEKNDLVVNVNTYYSIENLRNMGWMFISGWGGVTGMLTEFYNETGYFLTVRYNASSSIVIWISNETTIVPVIPTPYQ